MPPIRIVITGATGFIGGQVFNDLVNRQGIEVIGVSRRASEKFLTVNDYSESPVGDILIHLAEDNRLKNTTTIENQEYTHTILKTMSSLLKKNYGRIIYASSGLLYGDNMKSPRRPNDEIFIDSPYTKAKSFSENAVTNDVNGIVVRLANVYGFGMSRTNVLSRILEQVELQGDLKVMDSSPVRDFIWVKDVVEGILSLALVDIKQFGNQQIYNLGTGIGTSIGDVARLALDLAGQTERRVVSEIQSKRESSIVLNINNVTQVCGWKPVTSLHSGIRYLLNSDQEVKDCGKD